MLNPKLLTPLTKKELNLLYLLCINTNKIVTYEEIEFEVYNNQSITSSTIRTLMKRLREKIGKELITTVVNVGYKINYTKN